MQKEAILSKIATFPIKKIRDIVVGNVLYAATAISGLYLFKSGVEAFKEQSNEKKLKKKIKDIVFLEKEKYKVTKNLRNKNRMKETIDDTQINNMSNNLNEESFNIESLVKTQSNYNNKNNLNNDSLEISSLIKTKKEIKKEFKKDLEFYYFVYIKCFKTLYNEEIEAYEKQKQLIYKEKNYFKYINYVEQWNKKIKSVEDFILREVFSYMGIPSELENAFAINEINTKSISKMYYEDLDIKVSKDLMDLEKLNEVVMFLFNKTKYFVSQLEEFWKTNKLGDEEYVVAESLAFNCAYDKFGYRENEIRKAIVDNDLNFLITKSEERN